MAGRPGHLHLHLHLHPERRPLRRYPLLGPVLSAVDTTKPRHRQSTEPVHPTAIFSCSSSIVAG
jgi:hypothetical protein